MASRREHIDARSQYRLRVLGGTAVALLVLIGAFRLWPPPSTDSDGLYTSIPQEHVLIEEVQQTRQSQREPPPPAPMVPIPVPNDVVLPEEIVEFELPTLAAKDPGQGEDPIQSEGDTEDIPAFVPVADEKPRPLRYVEPEFPKEASKRKIKAQVDVRVIVNQQGQVTDLEIVALKLLNDAGSVLEQVEQLGYGIEEAALDAARRWRFRPAKFRGRTVSTYHLLEFKFGV